MQGWGGGTGSFTLTRTCYSGVFYCQSGGRTANQEWIKTFSIAVFVKQSGSSHYSDYTSDVITMIRGRPYPVSITSQFYQITRTEYHHVWIDLDNQTINLTSGQLLADGQWKWMPGANSNITIQASNVSCVLTIPPGKTVEMQNLLLKGGTATTGSVIDNEGTLILRNTDLQRATGSSSTVLENNGTITIEESCDIEP